MKPEDLAAFQEWKHDRNYTEGKLWTPPDDAEIWQAACAHRDQQAAQAEPVAFEDFRRKAYELFGWVSELGGYNDAIRELYEYVTHPAPAVVQGEARTIIHDARVDSSIMSRAMEHPTVLEIMAACAEIIDTENSAVLGADYDGTALLATAKRLLEQAKQIRKSDPEIWEDCPVAGLTHPAQPAVAQEPDGWHFKFNSGAEAFVTTIDAADLIKLNLREGETCTEYFKLAPAAEPAPLVRLTLEEVQDVCMNWACSKSSEPADFANAIMDAIEEKNK